MSTGDGGDARDGKSDREERGRGGDRIGIGGGDDSVTRIQLAARWAESYSPESDSLGRILKRFRAAYDYLDAVIHGVEPADLDHVLEETPPAPVHAAVAAPPYAPPSPSPPEPSPQPEEPRPWG
jgi:hypothetical protein